MDIDAIIAEATQPDATQTVVPEIEAPAEPVSEPAPEPEAPWPKKAENALAKAKGQQARLKFQLEQERAARAALEQRLNTTKPSATKTGEPKEADYQNYADFIDAKQEWRLNSRLAERDDEHKKTQSVQAEQAWVNNRENFVKETTQKFVTETPEAKEIFLEYADVVDEFPPHIQRLFLEADNAPLAIFNLAKEGKLESLGAMTLARAAFEIGRAETQAIPPKPKSKAPIPLPAARGSVAGAKRLEDMSGDEIRAWQRAK